MDTVSFPKITFGIIVLNGKPFTPYCLRSIYPFAHEIIVVEGGHEDTRSVCTTDGHSSDDTLEILYKFKKEEDPQNKLIIITRNGFWPKKDELGRDRTPQSRAYAERATGDYLWQVDIDEFYKEEDMRKIIEMLRKDPEITAVTFPTYTFWGNIKYISDSIYLRRGAKYYHRLFKWSPNYRYLTHEPPTILDDSGIDLRERKWISGETMLKKNIFMYHYSLLLPWQVEQKVKIYKDEKPEDCKEMVNWALNNYFKISNPYRTHNVYRYNSWLLRYKGTHPVEICRMMEDIQFKKIDVSVRQTDDVEMLLKKWWYPLGISWFKFREYIRSSALSIKKKFRPLKKIYKIFFN